MIPAATKRDVHTGVLLTALLLFVAITGPNALAANEAARGMFVVANPNLRGTWFSQTVILLIQHDALGSVGVIINRPTDLAPADLLPDVAGAGRLPGTLYLGGPVERYAVTLLVRSKAPPDDAAHVFGDVYASGSRELLLDIIHGEDSSNRVRLYAGYAGWTPGQLDAEIARGSWTILPANEDLVFSSAPDEIWELLEPSSRPIIVRRDDGIARL